MARKSLGYTKLVWTCPNCGTQNPGPQKTCGGCGSPQPDDVAFEQADQQVLIKDKEEIEKAEKGPDTHCGFCGARNPAGTEVCSQCGADLKEGKQRESGQVIGAFKAQTEPLEDKKCPNCDTMNPGTASTCSACGGKLDAKKEKFTTGAASAPDTAAPKKRKFGCGLLIGIAAVLGIIALIIFLILGSLSSKSTTATVDSVHWERSVVVEEFGDVTKEDWKQDIPADAVIGDCEDKHHHTQDEPEPGAVEICGTPYTEDEGSGFGEVVQDCEYEVYEDYCEYTVEEWRAIEEVSLQGSDLNPAWPDPQLTGDQRLGEQSEGYSAVFNTGSKTYTYTTSSYNEFSQFQSGSKWKLDINALNKIKSIEPAN